MNRLSALGHLRARLLRRSLPRVQMTLIVVVTGLAGFFFSWMLLRMGLSRMALRYPLAAILAYGVFLIQLRLWLAAVRHRLEPDLNLDLDPGDFLDFDLDLPFDLDLDDAALLIIPTLIAAAGVCSAVYIIYSAPALFAEIILDAVIVASLYRRFTHVRPEGWLPVAFRRTWVPLAALVVSLSLVGFAAGFIAPGADSIGDLFRQSPIAR